MTASATTTTDVTGALVRYLHSKSRNGRPGAVFVEIALSGSWGSRGRLDVAKITVQPNYAGIRVDGYEVKTSRGDLARDLDQMKWRKYLGVCDTLTFVTPAGLASKAEIPDDAGLMVVNDVGRVQTVRRAPLHNPTRDDAQVLMRTIWRRADEQTRDSNRRACCDAAARLGRMRQMDEDDDQNLRFRLSRRVQDMINDALGVAAAARIRESTLDRREARIEVEAEQAGAAPEVLQALADLLLVGRRALEPAPGPARGRAAEANREVLIEAADGISDRAWLIQHGSDPALGGGQ